MFEDLQNGRVDVVLSLLRNEKATPASQRLARAILDAPVGHTSEAWVGPLHEGHHLAAEYVQVASAKPEKIARGLHTSGQVAATIIPLFHSDHLEMIADRWAQRFVKNPKNWDFLPQFDAMFEWVRAGLMAPPTTQGAALLLVGERPTPLADLLADRDFALARTTLPVLFRVPGVKGASLTQIEETSSDELRTQIIPWLIDDGVWDKDEVRQWTDLALAMDRTAYDKRWFLRLKEDLA